LLSIINRALDNGGVIVIPAFSVGRTQELLYDMEQLIHSHALSKNLPIIIDSPMANKITHAYRQFKQLWATEAKHTLSTGRHPLAFDQCITIDSHQEHIRLVNRLASTEQAAIVVAASGMCTGGRVVNYLKSLLPLTSTDVIFCGYQARGTLGSALSQQPKSVSIDGDPIEVNATAHTISGYSAHADKADLTKFVEGIGSCIQQVHLIHGEGPAKSALKADLMHLKNVKKVIE
jgi:metallo-beta-lactamase family protein